jgi:hypothetical protein
MYQQTMNQTYNQLQTFQEIKCLDQKNLTWFVTFVRLNGFSTGSAYIQNKTGTKSQNLELTQYNPMSVSISVGGINWELSHGDKITVILDDQKKTLIAGSNFANEYEWQFYAQSIVLNSIMAYPIQSVNSNSNRNTEDIDESIRKTQSLIESMKFNRDHTTLVTVKVSANSQIVELNSRLNEYQEEKRKALLAN